MKNINYKKLLSILLTACLVAALCVTPGFAANAISVWDGSSASSSLSGAGTQFDNYIISTAADLKYFADQVNSGTDYSGKYIKLADDIDLDDQPFTPIGNTGKYFRGYFDGRNHTISGVNISNNLATGTGFFGALHNGWIKNLHVEGSVICTLDAQNYVGGLVGYTSGNITIFNCSFNGLVRSANSNANRWACGGLVGYLASCTAGANIVCCYTSGTVDTTGRSGGLIGALENNSSDILNIRGSFSDATVTGSSAGTSTFESTGTAGGILGFMQAGTVNINDSFFAGVAPYKRSSGMGGPIVNHKAGGTLNLTRVYFDNEKNLLNGGTFAAADDGTGATTNTLAYTTWGYIPKFFEAGNAEVKHPTPRLTNMGKGSESEPYVIDSKYDLMIIAQINGYGGYNVYDFFDNYFVFGADINFNGEETFTTIGSTNQWFRARSVDGRGFSVNNLIINTPSTAGVGLFGAKQFGTIKNLNVRGSVTCTTAGGAVAGLVGKANSVDIVNCSFDGTVTSANTLTSNGSGGWALNHMNYTSAAGVLSEVTGTPVSIDKCFVSGTIVGYGRSGSLVGSVNGAYTVNITNSGSTADVTVVDNGYTYDYRAGGGLIGFLNSGTINMDNCYYYGTGLEARSNGMAGPIMNHYSSGTFNCSHTYYNSDKNAAEPAGYEYGEGKTEVEFADGTVKGLLNAGAGEDLFKQGEYYPVAGVAYDVDGDFNITVGDANRVLRYIDGYATLSAVQQILVDADGDFDVDIVDYFVVKSAALNSISAGNSTPGANPDWSEII